MPKGNGTYYIANAAVLKNALVRTEEQNLISAPTRKEADQLNLAAEGDTVAVWVPAGAASSTRLVEVEKTTKADWAP